MCVFLYMYAEIFEKIASGGFEVFFSILLMVPELDF